MSSAIEWMNIVRKRIYELQPKQLEASYTFKPFRLYGGAKGGGKSHWLRAEATGQCLTSRGINGLILRRTFPEVEKNFLYPFQREVPITAYKYNAQNHRIKFFNDSTIELGYCKNMTDVLRYQGIEYDFIGIEELTHWSEDEFDTIISSLRTSKEWVTPNFFWTTNPWGKGHAWVKKRWIDREPSETYDIDDYAFIQAFYTDNHVLLRMDPNYIKRLNALPEKLRRALRDGDWDIFEGQYFEEFRHDLHTIPPFVPPKGVKKRIISFDYGYTAPSAVYWMAQLYDGRVICYRELYVTKHTYRQLATRILAMTPEWELEEIGSNIFADPAIFKKNESTWTSAEDDMIEVGLYISRADNVRVAGWNTVREGFQLFQNPNTGIVSARVLITKNCSNLIRTLPMMIHDARNPEDLDSSLEDHASDAFRYWLREFKLPEADIEFLISVNDAMKKKNVQNSQISIKYWQSENQENKAVQEETPEEETYDQDDKNSILNSDF